MVVCCKYRPKSNDKKRSDFASALHIFKVPRVKGFGAKREVAYCDCGVGVVYGS